MNEEVSKTGVGTIILFSFWITAIIFCLLGLRTKAVIGFIPLGLAIIVTIILLAIPRAPEHFVEEQQEKEYDYHSVWRNLFTTFLSFCSFGSIFLFCNEKFKETKKSVPVSNWLIEK